jgi:cellulose synthase/poly-beta-1,6-N-acetylglucosamine synthase-like glycosyltransferase
MGAPIERYYHKPTATAPPHAPHVTVVIPTFNNTQQLLAAVRSVYAQDYANWELLIVGDKCPHLDAFMEKHKALFVGGCSGGGGEGGGARTAFGEGGGGFKSFRAGPYGPCMLRTMETGSC